MSSSNRVIGYVIAAIGGGLGLLAFFSMALFSSSAGILSISAEQIAGLSAQYGNGSGSSFALDLYWIAPVVAGLIALIALFQFRSSALMSGRKTAGGWVIVLAIVGLALYIGEIIYIVSQGSSGSGSSFDLSYLGAGFWAFVIGMVGALVGALIAMNGSARVASGPPTPLPYTQYPPNPNQPPAAQQFPPNQQPSSPQYPPYQQPQQYPPSPNQPPSSPQYPPQQYPPYNNG